MSVAYPIAVDPCAEVADALRRAGWPSVVIPIMVAVSRAESGCRTAATCDNCVPGTSEYSVGPFQINLQAHPEVSEECARDVFCAALAALRISGGGINLNPWTTFRTGAYKKYLPDIGLNVPPLSLTGVAGIQKAPEAWTMATLVVLGTFLLVLAVLLIKKGR